MLCIRKTLELGFIGAIAVGLAAALTDSIYAFIVSTGMTSVSDFLKGLNFRNFNEVALCPA
ncbi:MAG: hypothetical protein Q8S31_03675 [Alphaproteobacteria bacterium]|nr:hypothetical protein [Alphaproteobacteria bacterium]